MIIIPGLCDPDHMSLEDLVTDADDKLVNLILYSKYHVLHSILPDRSDFNYNNNIILTIGRGCRGGRSLRDSVAVARWRRCVRTMRRTTPPHTHSYRTRPRQPRPAAALRPGSRRDPVMPRSAHLLH